MKICANCLCIIYFSVEFFFKKKGICDFTGFENGKGELVEVFYKQRCQVCDRVVC